MEKFKITKEEDIKRIEKYLKKVYKNTVKNFDLLPKDLEIENYEGVGELEVEIKIKHNI